jgi:hypothetical protein
MTVWTTALDAFFSYGHDFNKIVNPFEVVWIARIEGQLDGTSRSGN